MTAQIPDFVFFKGDGYQLIGVDGDELPIPEDFGLKPVGEFHTACYRGYYSKYEIIEDKLFLKDITINIVTEDPILINGVSPEIFDGEHYTHIDVWQTCSFTGGPQNVKNNNKPKYSGTYKNINLPIPFTGMIQIGKDLFREYHVHMGFQKPSSFNTVFDLSLKNGVLTGVKNRSLDVERKRGRFAKRCAEDFLYRHSVPWSLEMGIEDMLIKSDIKELLKGYDKVKYSARIYHDLVVKKIQHPKRIAILGAWKNGCLRKSDEGDAYIDSKGKRYSFTERWNESAPVGYGAWNELDEKASAILSKLPKKFPYAMPFVLMELKSKTGFDFIGTIFLAHILLPEVYPLFNQHVYRAFMYQTDVECPELAPDDWKEYCRYNRFFVKQQKIVNIPFQIVDRALWTYGKLLKRKEEK